MFNTIIDRLDHKKLLFRSQALISLSENLGNVIEFVELICHTTNHFRYSRGKNSNTPCNFRHGYSIILYQPASNNPPCPRNKPATTPGVKLFYASPRKNILINIIIFHQIQDCPPLHTTTRELAEAGLSLRMCMTMPAALSPC